VFAVIDLLTNGEESRAILSGPGTLVAAVGEVERCGEVVW
jgi:hypothetical protein